VLCNDALRLKTAWKQPHYVYAACQDISLPESVSLTREQGYSTSILHLSPSPLGAGWMIRSFATLLRQPDQKRD
jgi:hypothetical protein